MKKTFLIFIFSFNISSCQSGQIDNTQTTFTDSQAQADDFDYSSGYDRIEQIKEWYKEASDNKNNPKKVNKRETEDGLLSGKKLTLRNGFEILITKANGDESTETTEYYFKDEKVFFAYRSGRSEGYSYQYRYYFSDDGEVIKILEKNDNGTGAMSGNREMQGSEFRNLSEEIKNDVMDAEALFYGC
ncbi:MAG: hypothetical protein ACKOA1_10160 [Bacteroidota bacterium]